MYSKRDLDNMLEGMSQLRDSLKNEADATTDLLNYIKTDPAERRKKREYQSDPYLRERDTKGSFKINFDDIWNTPDRFRAHYRMSNETFKYLFDGVKHLLQKNSPRALCPLERFSLTLDWLCNGGSFCSKVKDARVDEYTIREVVRETCQAIWHVFMPVHMPSPTREILEESARGFWINSGFPNCTMALDAKHFEVKSLPGHGNILYGHFGYSSLVIQAAADSYHRFFAVESSAYGKQSDAGIFAQSALKKLLEKTESILPQPKPLPHSDQMAPHIVVGDKGYPLTTTVLKPYIGDYLKLTPEQRLFNRKLSLARQYIEQAFGQLVAQFDCLRGPIPIVSGEMIDLVILTCCLLHNVIINQEKRTTAHLTDRTIAFVQTAFTQTKQTLSPVLFTDRNQIRDTFAAYFAKQQQNK